jgi:hypothetical protein
MKNRLNLLISSVFSVVLVSCSGSASNSTAYPSEVRESFMSSCVLNAESQGTETGKAQESCLCAFEALQSEFSYQEFSDAEQALIKGEASDIDFGEIASRCS